MEKLKMNDICRLCLTISPEIMSKITEESEVVLQISNCLSFQILINESLPNQVCETCVRKIEDIKDFRSKIIENQSILSESLSNGKETQNNFYNTPKSEFSLKEEPKEPTLMENQENENLYIPDHTLSDHKFNLKTEESIEFDEEVNNSSDDNVSLSALKQANEHVEIAKNRKKKRIKNNVIEEKTNEKITKNVDVISKFKCLTCFKEVLSKDGLINHYNTEHSAKDISKTSPSYTAIVIDSNTSYKCNACDKTYTEKRYINRHWDTHIERRPFICKICGRTYRTVSEIVLHGRAHDGTQLFCLFNCGYSTAYVGSLREHHRRHKAEFKYTCEECGKGFQIRTWYEEHQNVHRGLKPFVCTICNAAFPMSRYLTAHRSSVHPQTSSVKRYVCVHCSLPCDTRTALTRHMKEHGINTTLLCDICGKALANAGQLKFHKQVHFGVKPYSCSTCSKSFTKKFNLTLHERTHTGVKAYACARCGRHYTQRSTLTRHNARHHAESSHECSKCQKQFNSRKHLTEHELQCV